MKNQFLWLSLFSGILLSLPWVVQGTGWVLFVAFIPLFFAETKRLDRGRENFFIQSYPAFLIWNLLSTWWIAHVSILGMLFVVSANALLMSFAWWASYKVKRVLGRIPGYFSLVVFWISFEFLSHKGALPWPWLTLGNGFASSVKLIQWYEFTGVLGGSVWVLLVNVFTFETLNGIKSFNVKNIGSSILFPILTALVPILLSYYIYVSYTESGVTTRVVILQPNIDPFTEKFSGMGEKQQIERLSALMEQSISDSTELVVAPETALPVMWEDSLLSGSEGFDHFKEMLQKYRQVNFIGGAITKTGGGNAKGDDLSFRSFNSAFLTNDLQLLQVSHKTILVAGVEKTPFREYLNFLPDFLLNPGGLIGELTPGEKPLLLKTKSGELVGPVICFESAFGDYIRNEVLAGANYLAVLTNDGWWKQSAGTWQHFGYSRIRAIETRRSVCRSANTGISGCIDQRGEIICQSSVGEVCTLNCGIVSNSRLTFYVTYGDYLGKGCLIFSLAIFIYTLVTKGALKQKNPH